MLPGEGAPAHLSSAYGPAVTWDRLARVYDRQLWLERPALSAALELADVRPEERLLDLGTGTAALLRELARRPSRPREAVGVDLSSGMLARAPSLPPGWRLLRADATGLPFPAARFEVAAAAYLLHLLDEEALRAVVAEARRVLMRDGRLVTVTPAEPRSFLARPYAPVARCLARLAPRTLAGLRPFDPCAALVAGGFAVREARYVSRGYPSLCVLATRTISSAPNGDS